MHPEEMYREVRRIQARDLSAFADTQPGLPVARIGGHWREVFDVYDEDPDDVSDKFRGMANTHLGWASPCWVMVRYLDEAKSNHAETADAIALFRTCDLVEVQVVTPRDGKGDRA